MRITSSLDAKRSADAPVGESSEPMEPQKMIMSSLESQGHDVSGRMPLQLEDFFVKVTEEQMETYCQAANAVRSRNFAALHKMHEEGLSLQTPVFRFEYVMTTAALLCMMPAGRVSPILS
eukprot:12487210-Ditylum_brightwellii.AAC.1